MAVQRQCTSCKKLSDPFIDPKTEKVYCGLCEKEMAADHFLKIQLKTLKQFKQKTNKPFSIKCWSCGKEDTPVQINKEFYCSSCKKQHKLTEPFKIALRINLPNVGKEIPPDPDDSNNE